MLQTIPYQGCQRVMREKSLRDQTGGSAPPVCPPHSQPRQAFQTIYFSILCFGQVAPIPRMYSQVLLTILQDLNPIQNIQRNHTHFMLVPVARLILQTLLHRGPQTAHP